ncbi:MAG: efflux RND transporter periplasmic adaptor subunit [Candidatus Komeilibacteria bacterium]|jgi:HlyD family secretion protein|nr:efflux RND transporter periplasmic adaptor subunit [Candidatus Komeilibacteria bacterium]MBT4447578.1 efflux RND transporter periplasmic adaptor subunit [Candidatus Komeilibacteria bacterium]
MLDKLKSKWFWIILVIVVVVAIILWQVLKKEESNYVTEKSIKADIIQTVEVTGSVESADDIDLNFNRTGTLQAVLVKAGDQVNKGQVLARLSAGDVASQVADARASLDIAKLQLDQLLAGASDQDVAVTEQELASAQSSYNSTLEALSNLEQTRDQELENLKQEAINTLKDKESIAKFSIDLVYDALMDTDADNYLYVTDIILLSNTQVFYSSVYNDFLSLNGLITQAEIGTNEDILSASDFMEANLEDTLKLLTDTYDVMGVAVNNSTYTSTVVDTLRASINTKATTVNTAISAVQTDSAYLRTRELYYQTQISEKQNSIGSYKIAMDLAQAKLDFKIAPPRDFEISSAEANIKRAQATVDRYLSNWSETVITAPVDGIVTEVNFDVGEQTSMSGSVVSMIGLATMQIEVDVPESDINKLAVSDQVEISLDAFSSDEKFMGTVTFIDPAATNIDGVVYYTTKVAFNEKDERIKSGMTADLTISTDAKEGVLVVPSRAVIYRDGKKYIQTYDGVSLGEVEVSTGLRGDGGLTEILSGLEEGVDVVTFIKKED